jgi:hypothetical protein
MKRWIGRTTPLTTAGARQYKLGGSNQSLRLGFFLSLFLGLFLGLDGH